MANNYTMASFLVPMTKAQVQWVIDAEKHLENRAYGMTEELPPAPYVSLVERLREQDLEYSGFEHCEETKDGLWIAGMESFNPEYAAILLHEWMLAFDIKSRAVSFQYAETCSKPRCDEFGGGAVVVSHAGFEFLNTASWVERTVNALTESELV